MTNIVKKDKNPIYKEKEMIEEASSELCRSLLLTSETVAVLAATKYLIKKGYRVIRVT